MRRIIAFLIVSATLCFSVNSIATAACQCAQYSQRCSCGIPSENVFRAPTPERVDIDYELPKHCIQSQTIGNLGKKHTASGCTWPESTCGSKRGCYDARLVCAQEITTCKAAPRCKAASRCR